MVQQSIQPEVGLRGYRVMNPQRTEERRQGILLAAAEVFARKGYGAASLDDVAERCGVTKSVIYYYFRNKEALYVELMTETLEDAVARVEAIRAAGEPPAATLRAMLADSVRRMISRRAHYVITLLHQGDELSDANRERLRGLRRRNWRVFEQTLEAGIAAGVFVARNPRLMARTAVYACASLAHWYSPSGSLSVEYVVREVTEQVAAGILRHPERAADERDGAGSAPTEELR